MFFEIAVIILLIGILGILVDIRLQFRDGFLFDCHYEIKNLLEEIAWILREK